MIKNINDMKNIIFQGCKLGKQHKHFYRSNSNMKKYVILRKLTHLNQCRLMDTKLMRKYLYYLLLKDEIVVHFS
jgi:hypothetical protein